MTAAPKLVIRRPNQTHHETGIFWLKAQKYVMYRKPTSIPLVFWRFLYITYFCALTYTDIH
jgi:hypothetical protein